MNEKIRLRFPPSPTGLLHVGNVRTALYNWILAKKFDGTFVLRIENTDVARSTRENEEKLLNDMKWLGLEWNEGPGADESGGPFRQSERLDIYRQKIRELFEEQKVYYCFCSPQELDAERKKALAEKRPPKYSGKCRNLNPEETKGRVDSGEEAAVRFRVEDGPAITWDDLVHGEKKFEREVIGDFIIVRSDGMPAYNFAVTIDDALMRISHVIRGDDHISNTPRQILLYQAMSFPLPAFAHLPMILGPDGSRLSKRHGATSVEEFRNSGYLPEALINFLALLGWNPGDEREIFRTEELIEAFSIERINRSAAMFNLEKLDWLNGRYIRSTPPDQLLHHLEPFLRDRGFMTVKPEGEILEWYYTLIDTFADSSETLVDLAESSRLVFEFQPERDLNVDDARKVLSEESAPKVIHALFQELQNVEKLDANSFKELVNSVKKKTGEKGPKLFHPIRVGITGAASGPELKKLIPLLENGAALDLHAKILSVKERVELSLKNIDEN